MLSGYPVDSARGVLSPPFVSRSLSRTAENTRATASGLINNGIPYKAPTVIKRYLRFLYCIPRDRSIRDTLLPRSSHRRRRMRKTCRINPFNVSLFYIAPFLFSIRRAMALLRSFGGM
jgi:hypothetical protein